jgi:hypothetical protein
MDNSCRKLLAQLRCGSIGLSIELDRWKNIPREDRKCCVCVTGLVEDEKHFLLDCYVYNRARKELFDNIRLKTSQSYDLRTMYNRLWMVDVLIGRNIGTETDRRIIRQEVSDYLLKAHNLRRENLGYKVEEAS